MVAGNKIIDELGYLTLNEDGAILESSGDLQNDERIGSVIMSLLQSLKSQLLPMDAVESFRKISINYADHCYIICCSNKKICIVKRKLAFHEAVKV